MTEALDLPPLHVLTTIARRHGLTAADVRPMPAQGVANHTCALGEDRVLRIARDGHERDLAAEAAVLPAARAAGVPAPALIEHHRAGPDVPAHLVEQRCAGTRLDAAGLDEQVRRAGYRDLGRVLRRLHDAAAEVADAVGDAVPTDEGSDADELVTDLGAAAWISAQDADWLHRWFDHLAAWQPPQTREGRRRVVVIHGDASGANVLVDAATGQVTALLDWGDAARADPASDLAKVPPLYLPDAVSGYAPGEDEQQTWAARALRHHLHWALGRLATPPRPGDPTWSAPPAARLLGLLRLLTEAPGGVWTDVLAPVSHVSWTA